VCVWLALRRLPAPPQRQGRAAAQHAGLGAGSEAPACLNSSSCGAVICPRSSSRCSSSLAAWSGRRCTQGARGRGGFKLRWWWGGGKGGGARACPREEAPCATLVPYVPPGTAFARARRQTRWPPGSESQGRRPGGWPCVRPDAVACKRHHAPAEARARPTWMHSCSRVQGSIAAAIPGAGSEASGAAANGSTLWAACPGRARAHGTRKCGVASLVW
jgi:hypothetical protein